METRGPLWALIDVYGNSTAIEFVDIRHHLNNSRRNCASNSCDSTPDEVERIMCPMQQMSIHQRENEELNLPILRYQPSHLNFTPMCLHRTRGRNVRFNSSRSVASRLDTEFCQGYVFTGRPLQIGERIVVQILATEPMFQGCLGLGLTSCDPSTLTSADLPDDSNFLLDRPEYWVISRDFTRTLNVGDEISFFISASGEVQISRNGAAPCVVIHVDQSLKLWAFFDVYGSTRKVRVLSYSGPTTPIRNSQPRIITTPSNSESMNSLNTQSELRRNSVMHPSSNARVQVAPSANGGAVVSVIIPPTHSSVINQQGTPLPAVAHHSHHSSQNSVHNQNGHGIHPSHYPAGQGHSGQHILAPVPGPISPLPGNIMAPLPSTATGTMLSTCSNTYIEVRNSLFTYCF